MIRVFRGPTADDVWQQLVEAFRQSDGVNAQPSRDGPTKEILHVAISIPDPKQRWVVSREPPLNVAFALAEVVWIMTGRRDLAFLEFWNGRLRDFVGPGPDLHGAYGYRLRHHLGLDQMGRACEALNRDPDSRQVVLQIWDSSSDLPQADGAPADPDVPCNVVSILKVRAGKLEWLQIIRSNDLFLGVPHNFVQFTCLQEIMAGWLGIECGSYDQISDSLHLYTRDEKNVLGSSQLARVRPNADSLALPREESELAFRELESRIERVIAPGLEQSELESLSRWDSAPDAYQNILAVLVAEAARRRGQMETATEAMSSCTNPVYQELWARWLSRVRSSLSGQGRSGDV
jgi:thymidylate synthase